MKLILEPGIGNFLNGEPGAVFYQNGMHTSKIAFISDWPSINTPVDNKTYDKCFVYDEGPFNIMYDCYRNEIYIDKQWIEMWKRVTLKDIDRGIEKVIFNEPATIILWKDKTKTVVKAQDGEPFDKEKGFLMAIAKRLGQNKGNYNEIIKKWCSDEND